MVLRLDLNNPKDREFLKKRIPDEEIRQLLSSSKSSSIITNALDKLEMTSVDKVKTVNGSDETKQTKYGNKKVFCSTLQKTIDSTWEHELFHMLKSLEDRKKISDLQHNSIQKLIVNDILVCRLEIDFQFNWLNIVRYVDAKSEATSPPSFKTKVKLFTALFGQPVYLVERKKLGIYEEILYGEKKQR